MYKIRFVWVGKTQDPLLRNGMRDYLSRLSRFVPAEILELKTSTSTTAVDAVKTKETRLIQQHLNKADHNILLDEGGVQYTSQTFAASLESLKLIQTKRVNFVIGCAHGFDHAVIPNATLLSLSPMTFPHQLTRLILLEQVYRAFTIMNNHRYHH